MKYLEAKALARAQGGEHKMLPGVRKDQGGGGGKKGPAAPPPDNEEAPEQESGLVVRPDVRALAEELGVDVRTIRGTGRNGAITKADVKDAAAWMQQAAVPVDEDRAGEREEEQTDWIRPTDEGL